MRLFKLSTALMTAALVLLAAASAHATDPSELDLLGGNLEMTAPGAADFPITTINGSAQSLTAALDAFDVSDNRGTGAGWHVTVQATQFKEWNGLIYVIGGRSLATGSLKMSQPSATGASPGPSVTTGPYTIDSDGAVTIASAAANAGMGSYAFSTTTLTLTVPGNAFAARYRSEVTVSITSGP